MLVIDDHRTFTDLLGGALDAEDDVDYVGAAHDAASARAMVHALRPDVVVMDVRLGEDDGLVLTRELVSDHPALRIIVLTAEPDGPVMRRAARAGACALLPKGGALSELLAAIRAASADGMAVHPALLRALVLGESDPASDASAASLTPQEERVLRLLAAGRDVRGISLQLGISVHTCRGYVKSILHKLQAHSQLEAVATARARGLLG